MPDRRRGRITAAGTPAPAIPATPEGKDVTCYCGGKAILGLHFTNYDHRSWTPVCQNCYQTHLENAQDTNDHEMRHYVIVWHNPPGTSGCWVMQSTEDPDAQHMALMPTLEDVTGMWEHTV